MPMTTRRSIAGLLLASLAVSMNAAAQTAREVALGDGAIPVAVAAVESSHAGREGLAPVPGESAMARRVRGELGEISRRAIQRLTATMRLEPPETRTPLGAQIPCSVRMTARDGSQHLIDLVRTCSGLAWLRSSAPGEEVRLVRVDPRSIEELLGEVSGYRGELTSNACPVVAGAVEELDCPFERSRHMLDARTLRQRIYGNWRAIGSGAVSGDLTSERFLVRAPRNYDPRTPAGLLVWVAAGESGEIPAVFFPALDELGCVAIGAANSGNSREINDRIQLALDGAATAQSRFHIDPRRVYVAGISGGAKIAAMTWACFPDVFAGAVPIVGMASYKDTPAGAQGVWPALFARPAAPLFRTLKAQRAAVMTGPPDFNYQNIIPMVEAISRDGIAVRVFEYLDMGHTLPTPERFRESFTWIDEPYRLTRAEEAGAAQRLLDDFLATWSPGTPPDESAITALNAVMDAGPWTPAAWKAVEILSGSGITPPTAPAKAP